MKGKVLTIAGSDPSGGAGIQADLKTITVLGGYGMSIITALTAQNTRGVQGIFQVPVDFVERQLDSVLGDSGVDAVKTGMLLSADIVSTVCSKMREYRIERLVVDPIIVSSDGSSLLTDGGREVLISELIPLALVVTPNIPEAEILSGISIRSLEDMKRASELITRHGVQNVIVKGGHSQGDPVDLLYDGSDFHLFSTARIPGGDVHGTGCTFSAAIAAGLAAQKTVRESVVLAKEYISSAIANALRTGGGRRTPDHFPEKFVCKEICREG
jgi:hydroxymethylpyrimidine/phosphomethylpyrimidine kinase